MPLPLRVNTNPISPSQDANSSFIPPTVDDLSEVGCQHMSARFVARIDEAEDESLQYSSNVSSRTRNVDPTPAPFFYVCFLEDAEKRREAHIQAMYDQLEGPWCRLGVSKPDMDAFVGNHYGTTEDTRRI